MRLIDVYADPGFAIPMLYKLLQERPDYANISHRSMPNYLQHTEFFWSRPYAAWYAIMVDKEYVGAVYLSRSREIGIGILQEHQGQGYAKQAIEILMSDHPGEFFANVAPENVKSAFLFRKLGFDLIQHTYRLA